MLFYFYMNEYVDYDFDSFQNIDEDSFLQFNNENKVSILTILLKIQRMCLKKMQVVIWNDFLT